MEITEPVPVPEGPPYAEGAESRLWIGNLDQRLTEYQLLKILQKFGTIDKFDLLFHRSGPLEGQPRGYAFVTYNEEKCAVKALEKLNGTKLGSKQVSVKWAHNFTGEKEKLNVLPEIPALAGAKKEGIANKAATIQAIEAKLRLMENSSSVEPDFSETPILALQPPPVVLARKEQPSRPPYRDRRSDKKRHLPYVRQKRR